MRAQRLEMARVEDVRCESSAHDRCRGCPHLLSLLSSASSPAPRLALETLAPLVTEDLINYHAVKCET